jgi:hypothetical protein
MMDDGWLCSDNVQNVHPAALWAKKNCNGRPEQRATFTFPLCACAVRPTGPLAFKEASCADRTLTREGEAKPTNWLRLQLLRLRAYLPAPSPPLRHEQQGAHHRWKGIKKATSVGDGHEVASGISEANNGTRSAHTTKSRP